MQKSWRRKSYKMPRIRRTLIYQEEEEKHFNVMEWTLLNASIALLEQRTFEPS